MTNSRLAFVLDEAIEQLKQEQREKIRYAPKEKLDKSIITYPCDDICMEKFEAEKQRQQSVILQTD